MIGAAMMHGWSGLAIAYGLVQAPVVAGLIHGRAPPHKYLVAPLIAVPWMVAAGVTNVLAEPLMSGLGLAPNGGIRFGAAAAIGILMGYAGGRVAAMRKDDSAGYQRGTLIEPARRTSRPRGKSRSPDIERGRVITLAGRDVPARDEAKHFKLIGTTGTGKSTAIHEMLEGALARGDRAVIADPDGGYLRRLYDPSRGDVILNPFDERSAKWDLFAEIRTHYDVDQLARSLIPDHAGSDRSWRAYARTFFSSVTRQAYEGGVTDVAELYKLLVVADTTELRELVEGTPAQPFLEANNSRMFDSIRSVTSSAVGALEYVAQQKTQGFSVRQWVDKKSPGVLFLPYKAGQIAALSSTISAWMRLAIFQAMDQDEVQGGGAGNPQNRLWFVVDELDALGQIDGLKDALARLRKFGGRCVLGFQSIAQVSSTYGQGDAHTIVENCGNTLILRCSASEGGGTARFASQLIGDREVLRTTTSRSRRFAEFVGSTTESEHLSTEPAVLPSQIEQLPDLSGYLKHASDPTWRQVRLDATSAWDQRRPSDVRARQYASQESRLREDASRE